MTDPINASTDDEDDWVYDVPTSPVDHGFFHAGDDWEFSPGFFDGKEV